MSKKFKYSKRSLNNLEGVHPDLVKVMMRAIELSDIDYVITEGTRTLETQMQNVKSGKSRTLNGSRHLKGTDGYSHAIDVVAYGVTDVWDFKHYYTIAKAIQQASKELDVPIRWGGAWHYRLNEESDLPSVLTEKYKRTQRETGKSVFLDGVHFELPNNKDYPQ